MSQSLSLSRRLSYFISNTISRRGYSTQILEGEAKVMRGEEMKKTTYKKTAKETVEKPTWIPDPKTGYYRPDHTSLRDTGLVEIHGVERDITM